MPEESQLRRINRSEFDCNPRAFWRAAAQRLDAANFLLETEMYLDAAYLAGYVVECSLKTLILERTPLTKRAVACRELTSGARCHNFDVLSGLLKLRGCSIPSEVMNCLEVLNDEWRTDLRYVGTFIPQREAEQFIKRARLVHDWVKRSR
jgi:HEPN domain-containing protein